MKKALIIGVTGQDGAYLSSFLLDKNYEVHGIKRRTSIINTSRIDHLYENYNFNLHYGELEDSSCLFRLINEINPDEIYNLGAMSHVKVSFEVPEFTCNVNAIGTLKLLEVVRSLDNIFMKKIRIYNACSSEMFGKVQEIPQKETTPFYPRSPYGCSKVFSYHIAKNYRESYDIFVSNGILFNHESPLRGETFVTRKITMAVAKIWCGLQDKLYLGNLDAKRDWGFAGDYVEAMWLMLQHDNPDDFIVATGETYSVKDFCKEAFSYVNLNWEDWVEIDLKYFRPTEVDILVGDASKAKRLLNWKPKVKFKELVRMMVDYDIELLKDV